MMDKKLKKLYYTNNRMQPRKGIELSDVLLRDATLRELLIEAAWRVNMDFPDLDTVIQEVPNIVNGISTDSVITDLLRKDNSVKLRHKKMIERAHHFLPGICRSTALGACTVMQIARAYPVLKITDFNDFGSRRSRHTILFSMIRFDTMFDNQDRIERRCMEWLERTFGKEGLDVLFPEWD